MEKFKIELFEKASGKSFPPFYSLSETEASKLIEEVKNLYVEKLKGFNIWSEEFYLQLSTISKNEEYTDNIRKLLNDTSFELRDELFVIWSESDIDKMSGKTFIDTWQDIWYPPSDYLVILFNPANNKLLIITHWWCIYYT